MSVSAQPASSVALTDQHLSPTSNPKDNNDVSNRLIQNSTSSNTNNNKNNSDDNNNSNTNDNSNDNSSNISSNNIANTNTTNNDNENMEGKNVNNDDKIDPTLINNGIVDDQQDDKSLTNEDKDPKSDITTDEKLPIDENKKLFFKNLKDLTDNISLSLSEIHSILPKIYEKNHLFKSYSNNLSNSDHFKSFDDFINNNDNKTNNNENSSDPDSINHSNNNNINNNSSSSSYNDLFNLPPIPLLPGTTIPDIDLNSQAKTVQDIWFEWTMGHKNKPPLQELEKKYGTRWRRGRIAKSAQRRKKVIEFIENEFKKHNLVLKNIINVVNDLENYRLYKGKGLFWLYGSLPDRLYDDAGNSIYKNVPKPLKNSSSDILISDNHHALSSSKISKNTSSKSSKAKSKKLSKILEDNLKNVNNQKDGENINDGMIDNREPVSAAAAAAVAAAAASTNNPISDDMDIDHQLKKNVQSQSQAHQLQHQHQAQQQEDIDLVNEIDENMGVDEDVEEDEVEEEDDEEEDDDDDVNMASVVDVAAMASMSVEGEDDEHALVNSAALAVAAQHVADQQRIRDQKTKHYSHVVNHNSNVTNVSENNQIQLQIPNEHEHDNDNDGVTDPALSKL